MPVVVAAGFGAILPAVAATIALPAIIAIGGLALLGCSGAPSTHTPAGQADRAAPSSSSQKSAPAPSGAPHGSEAEPRPAPTGTAPAAAATSGPATSAAASAARAPVAPLPPVVTTSGPATAGAPGAAAAGAAKAADPSVIVVDTPDFDPESQLTLAEAAKAEKERKAEATPPRIIINNKTIHRYAKGGQLTVAEPKKKAAPAPVPASQSPAATAGTAPPAVTAALVRDEKYWRGRALEIRQRWRKASDRIKELEEDIGLLRRRFYAQDDPYVRDGQIKPAWDHALDELHASRAAVQAAKKELTDFLDEGRIAGALPGWLREGIDLEPKEEKPVDPTQPIETPIYKDNGP
ncbi:MAG TPA: hypothetical protein VOA80_15390 [Thermoanaerobaculia bacterium]|nr:hypothetical protein [Thermoanaerobaculia bacterium]